MTDFKVLGINHTSFTVSNLDQTLAFYRDVLGFPATERLTRDPKRASEVTGVPGAALPTSPSTSTISKPQWLRPGPMATKPTVPSKPLTKAPTPGAGSYTQPTTTGSQLSSSSRAREHLA